VNCHCLEACTDWFSKPPSCGGDAAFSNRDVRAANCQLPFPAQNQTKSRHTAFATCPFDFEDYSGAFELDPECTLDETAAAVTAAVGSPLWGIGALAGGL